MKAAYERIADPHHGSERESQQHQHQHHHHHRVHFDEDINNNVTTAAATNKDEEGAAIYSSSSRWSCYHLGNNAIIAALLMSMVGLVCSLFSLTLERANSPNNALLSSSSSKQSSSSSALNSRKKVSRCDDINFREQTLKMIFEAPIQSLLSSSQFDDVKHELSEVVNINGYFYIVADSSWNLFKLHQTLPRFSDKNIVIYPEVDRSITGGSADEGGEGKEEDSSYEGIVYEEIEDLMYLIREAVEVDPTADQHAHTKGDRVFKAMIEEVKVRADKHTGEEYYDLLRSCPLDKEFNGDSKGMEGVSLLYDVDQVPYMLFMCEGNHCEGGSKGKEQGNGRVILARKMINYSEDDNCEWKAIRTMNLPAAAHFTDYSSMEINELNGYVVISSQEDSQVWIGRLSTFQPPRTFDPMVAEFEGDGIVLDLPRNDNCEIVYCNVEGFAWMPGSVNLVVAVSDKMKGKGRQSFRCLEKDQSVHVFALPTKWERDLQRSYHPSK